MLYRRISLGEKMADLVWFFVRLCLASSNMDRSPMRLANMWMVAQMTVASLIVLDFSWLILLLGNDMKV